MSNRAIRKAREVFQSYPGMKFPLDIEKIATEEGCEVVTWAFLHPVKEVKRGRYIGIAAGLEPREQRYLVAHALAHHLLHCGNQLAFHGLQEVVRYRQEREADECAAHILIPEEELAQLSFTPLWEIAEYFGVPEEIVKKRITEFATEEEILRWEQS